MAHNSWKDVFVSWISLLGILCTLLMFQTLFWPQLFQKYNLMPQITLPIVIYFFLHKKLFDCFFFIFFISLIVGSFSSISLVQIFLSYACICLFIKIRVQLFSRTPDHLFFEQVILWSLLFIYVFENLLNPSSFFNIPHSVWIHGINAVLTIGISFLMYPSLKKYLSKKDGLHAYL